MQKLLLTLFSILFITSAAVCQDWQWVREAGGPYYSTTKSIATDAGGNTYVVGNFTRTVTLGAITLESDGTSNAFLVKYSNLGGVLWAKRLGSGAYVEGIDITSDLDGNTYVIGNFKGKAILGAYTLTSLEDISTFVAKVNTNGEIIWARQVSSTAGNVKGLNIVFDKGGSVYVTGNFNKTATFGSNVITATKDEHLFIAKYDAQSGNVAWVRMAGGLGACATYDIATDDNGNLYMAGRFWILAHFGSITLVNNSDAARPLDMFIAKYDTEGNALWAQQAGSSEGNDEAAAITVDAQGNSYVTGYFEGRSIFGHIVLAGSAAANIFLAKYNASGELLWAKQQEGTGVAVGVGIDQDNDGNVHIAGHFEGTVAFGGVTLISRGSYDSFFAKYDTNGEVTGAIQAGGVGMDIVKKLQVSSYGGIYFTGETEGPALYGETTLNANLVIGKLNGISYNPELVPTIATGPLSTSMLCAGATVEVPFTTTGRFADNNVFTVQLSDASGSFTYATNIGSGASSPIVGTIPADNNTGTGFRIRVVASSPIISGVSNSTNLAISKPPVVTVSSSSKFIAAGSSVNLFAAGADSYVWSPVTGLSNARIPNPIASPQITTVYTVTGTKNGCTSTATVTVKVEPLPPAGSAFEWSSIKSGGATSHTEAKATVADTYGNVYVAGHFSDKITFGTTTLTVPGYVGYNQIYIVKYNDSGQVLWAKQIGGNNNDSVRDLALDKYSNLYITGWFDPAITIGSTTLSGDSKESRYFVAKFSPDGEAIWANQVRGTHNEVMAVAGGPNGEAYIAGTFGGTVTFSELSMESSAIKDYFLVKYNVSGEVEWARGISGTSVKGYRPIDLATDSEGNVYATGCFNKGSLVFGHFELTNNIEYTNSFLAKYSSNGQVQWAKFIGQNKVDHDHTTSRYIAVDKNDKVYIAGEFNRNTTIDEVALISADGTSDNFLAKYDAEGKLFWATEVGGGQLTGFTVDTEGFAYSTGFFSHSAVFGTRRFALDAAEFASYVVKHDPDGNVVWTEMAKAKRSWDVMSNGISVDRRQHIYIVGMFDRTGYHDPVTFGCHTIRNETSGPGHYYVAKLSPTDGPTPAIVTGKLASEALCAGSVINIPFSARGNGAGCSAYTVLLSDVKGSFDFARIIGTGSGSGNNITATIPANTAAGNGYRVKVIGSSPAVTGTDNGANLSITALPVVYISASVANPCPGTTGITYTASSTSPLASYTWTVPHGWMITEGQGTNRIKVTAGTISGEVTVVVRGVCSTEVVKNLSVTPVYVPVPTLWDTSKTICGANNAVFTASGAPFGATYRWYASATATEPIWEDRPSGSESRFYTPVVSETTYFYVSIRLSSGCEGERVRLTLNVNARLKMPGTLTASMAKPCAGANVIYEVPAVSGALGYEWGVPNGWTITSGQGSSRVSVVVGSGAGQVTVAAYNGCGSSPVQSLRVETGAPGAPTTVTAPLCGAGSVTIQAMGAPAGASYKWYATATGGAPIATGGTFITPALTATATYYVAAVTEGGCESPRTAVTAIIVAQAEAEAGRDETVCSSAKSFALTGYSPAGGKWSGAGVAANGAFDPAVAGVGQHELTYTYSSLAGCAASDKKIITVREAPVVTLADFEALCSTVQNYVLSGGQPAGGVYSGLGVKNGLFTPVDSIRNYPITYTYTNAAGCAVEVTKMLTVTTCTGMAESKSAAKLVVYPNPTRAYLNVALPVPVATDLAVKLYDTKGRIVFAQQHLKVHGEFKQVLDLKDRAKGIYLLQLVLEDGLITRRVVLE